ncbi:MAG: glycerophosphodiester phosphodiesterase family protein [Alistipes sp.]|nr:glycerophosphodiester phosphodiesterase family protein [Alistipes sp.]
MKRVISSLFALALLYCLSFTVSCQGTATEPDSGANRVEKILQHLHNPQSRYVIVVSHRGDWRNYPENSIPAIESVIKMGVDMVELDIAMTKDSVLILSHDRTLDRCTTGKGRISEITYDSLQSFSLKSAHGGHFGYELKIPTLREALEVCKDRIMINIDKGYDYYDQVLALTEELGVTNQILIKGGMPLSDVNKKMAAHKNNLLYMPIVTPASKSQQPMFEEYLAGEPQLAYEICWSEMTPVVESAIERVKASGSKLWVNTLWNSLNGGLSDDMAFMTSPDEIYGKLIDMGATMIQTDRPEFMIEYLRSRGLHD